MENNLEMYQESSGNSSSSSSNSLSISTSNFADNSRDDLDAFFDEFISSKPIFKDKSILQSNYLPLRIQHRDNYLKDLAHMLAPALRSEKPSNVFIYGKTGTGKTLCINYVLKKMQNAAYSREIPLKIIHINCKLKRVADTEYR
ncbi:MAG: hypothetical protein LAT82_05220, partial [Nanoarchaeota archaeon]|nr:hypothetical protein [Nanoarchaeota archaeon]